jgi:hypothetical protein
VGSQKPRPSARSAGQSRSALGSVALVVTSSSVAWLSERMAHATAAAGTPPEPRGVARAYST